jgi:c-di-GMP-binding flagellar brake protein YcgR
MNPILRILGLNRKAETTVRSEQHGKLPEINSFVDVAVGAGLDRESVPVNNVTRHAIVLRHLEGLEPGTAADLLYINASGKYRFRTVCSAVVGNEAYLELPGSIKTIEQFSARRMAERIQWVTQVQWRYAPDAKGFGDFLPASMMDVSRGGASLVVRRDLKVGSQVEVRFVLNSKNQPFVEICEVVRAAKVERSDKYAVGIRFLAIDLQDERILNASLEERRSTRRQRGVV